MYQNPLHFIKQYGSQTLAISTLQSCCEHFYSKHGYIAFTRPKYTRKAVVLGDPVCEPHHVQTLLSEFISHYPNAAFIQVSRPIANYLETLGHTLNIFGEEHRLDLPSAPLTWKSHKSLRRESNKATRKGITVKRIDFETLERHNYKAISKRWRSTRKHKGLQQFLTRPLPHSSEPDTLYLGAFMEDRLIGYAILSPMYEQCKVQGYYADITRYLPQHSECLYLLHLEAGRYLKQHNIKTMSLGISCYSVEAQHQAYSHPLIKYLLKTVLRYGNFLYAFKHLHQFKIRFHATKHPMYIASKSSLPILDLLHLFLITTRYAKPRF